MGLHHSHLPLSLSWALKRELGTGKENTYSKNSGQRCWGAEVENPLTIEIWLTVTCFYTQLLCRQAPGFSSVNPQLTSLVVLYSPVSRPLSQTRAGAHCTLHVLCRLASARTTGHFNHVSAPQACHPHLEGLSVTGGSRWCRQCMRSLIRVVSEPRSFRSAGLPETFWSFLAPGHDVCVMARCPQ